MSQGKESDRVQRLAWLIIGLGLVLFALMGLRLLWPTFAATFGRPAVTATASASSGFGVDTELKLKKVGGGVEVTLKITNDANVPTTSMTVDDLKVGDVWVVTTPKPIGPLPPLGSRVYSYRIAKPTTLDSMASVRFNVSFIQGAASRAKTSTSGVYRLE